MRQVFKTPGGKSGREGEGIETHLYTLKWHDTMAVRYDHADFSLCNYEWTSQATLKEMVLADRGWKTVRAECEMAMRW
jgi:hypothetical protein